MVAYSAPMVAYGSPRLLPDTYCIGFYIIFGYCLGSMLGTLWTRLYIVFFAHHSIEIDGFQGSRASYFHT